MSLRKYQTEVEEEIRQERIISTAFVRDPLSSQTQRTILPSPFLQSGLKLLKTAMVTMKQQILTTKTKLPMLATTVNEEDISIFKTAQPLIVTSAAERYKSSFNFKNMGRGTLAAREEPSSQNTNLQFVSNICPEIKVEEISLQEYNYLKEEQYPGQKNTISSDCFKCMECNGEFNSMNVYQNHMKNEHADQNNSCAICNKTFENAFLFSCHNSIVHAAENGITIGFKCSLCNAVLYTKPALLSHIKVEHKMMSGEDGQVKRNEESSPLIKVEEDFQDLAQIRPPLIRHVLMEEEEDTRTFFCIICKNEIRRTLKDLRQHYREEHEGRRLMVSCFPPAQPCDICGKKFKTFSRLKAHIMTHNNYFQCEECGSSHKKILEYVIHLRTHSDEGLFACLKCDFTTTEINTITNHLNNHAEGHKYWCEKCKKGFNILSWFQEHDNYHTGLKPFNCDICDKSFLYSRYLHAHRNYMHKDELGNEPNTYECVICKKQYQHKNSLKVHMNSHMGNYAICDICGKRLASKEKLKFHIRTHTGYKPFKCQYCDKRFIKKTNLVEHTRIHTGEKPHVCQYCKKAFSQRSSLIIHVRGHTGEKPHVCRFCQKAFVAKAMLNIHLKVCNGIIV